MEYHPVSIATESDEKSVDHSALKAAAIDIMDKSADASETSKTTLGNMYPSLPQGNKEIVLDHALATSKLNVIKESENNDNKNTKCLASRDTVTSSSKDNGYILVDNKINEENKDASKSTSRERKLSDVSKFTSGETNLSDEGKFTSFKSNVSSQRISKQNHRVERTSRGKNDKYLQSKLSYVDESTLKSHFPVRKYSKDNIQVGESIIGNKGRFRETPQPSANKSTSSKLAFSSQRAVKENNQGKGVPVLDKYAHQEITECGGKTTKSFETNVSAHTSSRKKHRGNMSHVGSKDRHFEIPEPDTRKSISSKSNDFPRKIIIEKHQGKRSPFETKNRHLEITERDSGKSKSSETNVSSEITFRENYQGKRSSPEAKDRHLEITEQKERKSIPSELHVSSSKCFQGQPQTKRSSVVSKHKNINTAKPGYGNYVSSQACSSASKKQTTCILQQNNHSKTTYLHLRLDHSVEESSDLHGSLIKRMQKPGGMRFEIIDNKANTTKNCTVVTLKFASRRLAQTAQRLLSVSNRFNKSKVFSSFYLDQLDSSRNRRQNVDSFQQQLKSILNPAYQSINNHEKKMKKTNDDIQKLKMKKHVPIDVYEKVLLERRPLEDKLKELKSQHVEFEIFKKTLIEKITTCWEENTFNKNIGEIRKLLQMECKRLDAALPMYARRSEIVSLVKENQVCVILGETGSGKSTQLTQYLHQAGFGNDGIIICTQPRKVAAISLATRVAQEMATNVGQLVGYRVGMQSKLGGNTKILYTTDHALLNECLKDKTLSKYSCVIIDEAHERSIYTDILLGIIKRCLHSRPDLKIIITSATIDPDVFVRYFDGCPVLEVSGRMFPVEVIWKPFSSDLDVFDNYLQAAIEKAIEIHTTHPCGDILVFMTTPLETEKCADAFKQRMKTDNSYRCLVLHGQVQATEQQLVFKPTPSGQRKIVFATNSAETSITIPGIKYVVDTGLVKEKRYDPKRNMNSLNVVMISQSSAEQRKGRAGRTGPGICYRLYSEEQYTGMEPSSSPEILTVNLDEAMLKLVELGINPLQYDFVQSPTKQAIEGAILVLEDIGAVKNQQITEQGRWFAKLPVEPRLGSIIVKGKERNVLYESVVLSAVSSVGSFIFYRGGSESDKNQSDLLKLNFCHKGGDTLTFINIFREWSKQPEKDKNAWCFDNSINSKAIRSVREMVNEICTLLKKELGLVVKHSFGDCSNTDTILQQILFECFSANICHFLGHERAGYYAASLDQVVNIHPSSVFNPLGLVPQWVVFEQVLKTSKDFVTGLTPVEDSVVHAAAENGTLRYDIEVMKDKQVYLIHTECVGSRTFWRIVGQSFSKLRTLQEKACSIVAPSCAVIEADKEKGEFKMFATRENSDVMTELLKPDILMVNAELQLEDVECALSEKKESVNVVIAAGGEVTQVLMPDEYRTVFIDKPQEDTTEKTVTEKFFQFGIKECRMFKNKKNDRWGCVTFEKSDLAKKAVISTQDDQFEVAVAGNRGQRQNSLTFQAKITWCRRMSKQHAFVDMEPEVLSRLLSFRSLLLINGRRPEMGLDRDTGSSLYLSQLSPDTQEDDIKFAILKSLGRETDPDIIQRVRVVREKVMTTPEMLDIFTSRIKAEISKYAPSGQFSVEVIKPKPWTVTYLAFASFCQFDECQEACHRLSGRLTISSREVTMMPDISTRLFIPCNVLKVIGEDLRTSIDYLNESEDKATLILKELGSGNYVVDIHSSSVEQMAKARSVLQDIIKGDVLECKNNSILKHIFSMNGKQFLEDLQSKLPCLIFVDNRMMTISIKANSKVCNTVRIHVDDFLKDTMDGQWKIIHLRGNQKPGGVMKMLTTRYGLDLDILKKDVGLISIELDHRRHRVEVRGPSEAIEKTETVVQDIITELAKVMSVRTRVDERPDCVVCFMPVESGQLYRLEACSHPYCMDCIKFQLQVAVKNKDFPVDCSEEQCKFHFMWRDFSNFIKNGSIPLKELVASSVSAFVIKNQKDYHYCITPNCPVIYRVSSDGSMFKCCECQMTICTSCHIQYHDGLTCAMYRSEREGRSALFEKWMKKKRNAKRCPNCEIPVQKENGCHQMECYACKKIFCWLCLDVFDSLQKCYAHLKNNHGGFM